MSALSLRIAESRRSDADPSSFALWELGFRPFYLLASLFASLSIALWTAQVSGWLERPYLAGPLWHAHEMLFGFTLAVMVGFLLTAVRTWSNRPAASGLPLALLAGLWLAGRVLVLTPFGWTAAIVNVAFPVAAAAALAIPLWQSRNRRNYFFVAFLASMSIASLGMHLSHLDAVDLSPWLSLRVALDLMLFVMVVLAGRVIPMFTNNGVPGAGAARHPVVETTALVSVLLLLVADAVGLRGTLLAAVALVCAAAHGLRWLLWKPLRTWRHPIVWVLHVAYAWIPLHLALRAASELTWLADSVATHALTVGAAGGLIIGMMTRTARGHTGRPLRADGPDIACYTLVLMAASVRVGVPLAMPTWSMQGFILSAALWSMGFALYFVRYWPVLTRPLLCDGEA